MRNKYYLTPGTVTGYKARDAKHLAKWFVRVVFILLALALLSGVVRGCMHTPAPAQKAKVST